MFARSKVALTFFCLVVALGLATVSEANSLVTPARGHAELSRMIKKRADSTFPLLPIIGAGADPNTSTASTGASSATSASAASGTSSLATSSLATSSAASTSSSAASSSATSASSATTSSDTSSLASSSATSTSSSTTSSSATSTSSSATPTSTSSDADLTFTNAPGPDTDTQTSSARSTSTNFVTVTDSSAQASATSGASTTGAVTTNDSHITRTTLIVIAVIASTVGGIALAWTIFRKWKLRPSSNFDERMQPIDWQPTAPEDAGIIPSHRRAGSNESHGSFKSSSHGHGAANLQPLPEHDFTAGASTLAPVGGYADLQRGPSPQPSMAELSRGPSMNRPGYDYGVPMHHQGMGGAYDYGHGARY
ncbi:hypothetical protein TRAPUB_6734 [Trametes pubescens]|uniref:Mid2 domain-containing protein n=1 Tax=Trametes pubescens TaxID=154538 RepID=A0A1M2V544_TRAPU|nr:hypothetical protein TRAPUB_6734 [Trametes pubescens]